MATTTKNPADKKRKQIYLVAGLGVILAVILAIQVPRLMGGGSEAAPSSTSDSVPTSGTPGTGGFAGSASLGNVSFGPGIAPKPEEGQLASFSLFVRHDPFVQLVKDADATAGSQDGEPVGVQVKGGGAGGASAASGGGTTTGTSDSGTSSGLAVATIWVNGTDEAVDVKGKFPKADPTFVLLSLKPKVAQIGVVGGAFTGGQTVALKMGQPLTLVNTTTGARYTLKLLYTGSEPEQVQQFTQGSN
jgi:hypothetical protein